jgi:hypothetical protein
MASASAQSHAFAAVAIKSTRKLYSSSRDRYWSSGPRELSKAGGTHRKGMQVRATMYARYASPCHPGAECTTPDYSESANFKENQQ